MGRCAVFQLWYALNLGIIVAHFPKDNALLTVHLAARDFYLRQCGKVPDQTDDQTSGKPKDCNPSTAEAITKLTATKAFLAGQVVLLEDELPSQFLKSTNPNCQLAMLEPTAKIDKNSSAAIESDSSDDQDGEIVMVALRDIRVGENLTIAYECEESNPKSNTALSVDPRLLASKKILKGQVALSTEDMPDQLVYAEEPNCLLSGEHTKVLLALRDIQPGEPLTIAVPDDADYDEWEMDLGTQEMSLVGTGDT